MRKLIIGMALCAAAGMGWSDALTDDDLVFDYQASENLALAKSGGAAQGQYNRKNGNITLVKTPDGSDALQFKNPGADSLDFPVTGNLPQTEGTIIFSQSYAYDSAAILNALKEKKQWSKMLFLFRSSINSGGVGFFHEVNTAMPVTKIRLTAMVSSGPHQWQYEGVTLDAKEFAPGKPFDVGFSWKGKAIAFLVNGKIIRQTELKAEPSWGKMFQLGGSGDTAFDGTIKQMKIYVKAAF